MAVKINTSDIKVINLYITEYNISKAKDYIVQKCDEVLDSNSALSILVTLCRTISENSNVDTENDIFYIANICSTSLLTLKNIEKKETFLLSLYHIVKYFLKRKSLSKILLLLNFLKQSGINENFKSDIYNYYAIIFYNYIVDCAQEMPCYNMHNIVLYYLQLQSLLRKFDLSNFISKLKTFTIIYKYPSINNSQRDEFCTEVLKLFGKLPVTQNPNDLIEIYTILLRLLNVTTHCLSICEDKSFPDFVYDHFKNTLLLMKEFCTDKEYIESIEIFKCFSQSIFKKITSRSDTDLQIILECNKKLKTVARKRITNRVIDITCREFQKIFRIFCEYFQNCKELWNEYFPVSLQLELLKTIDIIGNYLLNISSDKCSGDCKSETDSYSAAVLSTIPGVFVSNSLRLNLDCSDEFHDLSLKCLTTCCKIIKEHQLYKCCKYKTLWKVAGSSLYNTAVFLYRKKEYKLSKLYSHIFITYLIAIEGVYDPEVCFPNSLGASLHLYAVCCNLLKERKEAMIYLSLIILLSSEYKKQALQTWITLKSGLDNDENEYKTKTVHNILLEEEDYIKQIYPSYIYNPEICEELLMIELQHYYENWQSRGSLNNVCNEICKISKNINRRTKCFIMTWEKIISLLDSNYIRNIEATIELITASTDNMNNKVCLSVLYFILYQSKMQEIIDKNITDMNEAQIPLKSTPSQPYEEPLNPNDKCDIVPLFYNMKIDNLLKMYALLDKFLEIWSIILEDKHNKLDFDIVSEMHVDTFFKLIAFEYRMQGFYIHMLKMWVLYYKFGKRINNSVAVVTSIGFIIECSDCKSKIIENLEKEAEELLIDLNKNDPEELETYLTYYINKSIGYLNFNFIEEGYTYLCIAMKFLEKVEELNLKTCEARILFLKTQYLMFPCISKVMKHDENFLLTAQHSFGVIAEHFKTNSRCPYLLSILFEISLAKGWMYKWLRLPREVRCYTKESILLAQKYVLSIRTAQFLSLLAFTDLLDMQYSDCEVKLNGLRNLLCYTSNSIQEKVLIKTENTKDIKVEIKDNCRTSDVDSLIPRIQTVLDISHSFQRTSNLSSPVFRKKPFSLPEFIKHSNSCSCFMCSNSEYQNLIFDTVHLQALLNLYQGVNLDGEEYFQGGLILYENVRNKLFSLETINFTEKYILSTNVYKKISYSFCHFLLNYSYFLIKQSNYCDAKSVVDTIYKLLMNVNFVDVFFLSELNIQKLNLCHEPDIEDESVNAENELKIETDDIKSVTPNNKLSAVNLNVPVSPAARPKRVTSFKKLTFDLSDQENELNSDKLKTPEKNKNLFIKLQTPAKTPAPSSSKIKIYTPKTVRPKRNKAVTVKTPLPNTTNTEVKKSVNKQLEERTRLLMEKLKAEKKPVIKINDTVDNKLSTNQNEESIPIRKQLLNDLNEVTTSVDKLSLNCKGEEIKKVKHLENSKIPRKYTRIKPVSTSSSESSPNSPVPQRITRARRNKD